MSDNSASSGEHGLLNLWSITVLSKELENHQQINPKLVSLFRQYQKENGAKTAGSFISPDNFAKDLKHSAMDVLKKFIMDSVYAVAFNKNQTYWKQFQLQSFNIDITGLWFQICNDYVFHETHVHGNCSWSGVYYVQPGQASQHEKDRLPNGMLNGVTRFYGPQMEFSAAGHGDWGNYYLQDNTYTSYPKAGRLLVFPSYLKHMAYPYKGEDDRIIVSFHAQVNSVAKIDYRYGFS